MGQAKRCQEGAKGARSENRDGNRCPDRRGYSNRQVAGCGSRGRRCFSQDLVVSAGEAESAGTPCTGDTWWTLTSGDVTWAAECPTGEVWGRGVHLNCSTQLECRCTGLQGCRDMARLQGTLMLGSKGAPRPCPLGEVGGHHPGAGGGGSGDSGRRRGEVKRQHFSKEVPLRLLRDLTLSTNETDGPEVRNGLGTPGGVLYLQEHPARGTGGSRRLVSGGVT